MTTFVPPFFGKLGKKVGDLFKKKYSTDHQLIAKHTTAEGVNLETTADFKGTTAGKVKAGYKDKSFGEFELEVGTSGNAKGKAVFNKLTEGVELTGEGSQKGGKMANALTATYKQDFFATGLKVQGLGLAKTKATGDLTIGIDGLSVGGMVEVDLLQQSITDKNVGMELTQNDFTATLTTEKNTNVFTASFFHKVNKDYQIGARFKFQPNQTDKNKKPLDPRVLEIGTHFNLDADTCIRTKLELPKSEATIALEHKLANPQVMLALTGSFGLGGGTLKSNNFGLQATLGDF